MRIDWIDAVGLLGSTLFVIAFVYANRAALLDKRWFNALNLVGALLLLWSLWHRFNLAAFVLEVVWGAIALIGLVAAFSKPKPSPLQGRGLGEGESRNLSGNPLPPTPTPKGEREL